MKESQRTLNRTLGIQIKEKLDEPSPERPSTVKALAYQLGIEYQSLSYWLSARNNIPACILPELCNAINDFGALNTLVDATNHVMFPKPVAEHKAAEAVLSVQKLIEEVSHALKELAKTLEDGIVEEHELPPTIKELDDVIRECARLKYWLKERCKIDSAQLHKTKAVR